LPSIKEFRSRRSSYASLANPEEGTSLNYISVPLINGIKCAKNEEDDVAPEIQYCQ